MKKKKDLEIIEFSWKVLLVGFLIWVALLIFAFVAKA
jgi:uncharacterized integral membrane protein